MNISPALSAATLALALALPAHAITHKTGVIESVNKEAGTIRVASKNGAMKNYKVASQTKVTVEGKSQSIDALAPNQVITLALAEPAEDVYVSAEILDVNVEERTALVKPAGSKEAVQVKFSETTKVSGKVGSIEELTEGHKIKIKYATL